MAQAQQPPPYPEHIVGYSRFVKQGTPYVPEKIVQIYGEEHSTPLDVTDKGVDFANFLNNNNIF